jgi:hypothetical protein
MMIYVKSLKFPLTEKLRGKWIRSFVKICC